LSKGEKYITKVLRDNAVRFSQEHAFSDLVSPDGGRLRFDFAIWNDQRELLHLIEYDGAHHFRPLKHLGGAERFRKQQRNDALKDAYCRTKDIPLIRVRQPRLALITLETLCPTSSKSS